MTKDRYDIYNPLAAMIRLDDQVEHYNIITEEYELVKIKDVVAGRVVFTDGRSTSFLSLHGIYLKNLKSYPMVRMIIRDTGMGYLTIKHKTY